MISRLWQFLTDSRVLGVLSLAVLALLIWLGAGSVQAAALWAVGAGLALAAIWCLYLGISYLLRKRAAFALSEALVDDKTSACKAETEVLRKSVLDAIATIKTSKLGMTRGAAALYDLPWYMIIGNPAAGKSSAIGHSGLQFPITESKALHGVGGTRHCDWFFTTEGIVLDTAGRYAVQDSERGEWLGFLDLLKKYRSKAPINGIIIAASVTELSKGNVQASIDLAKSLRSRVQELTERLAIHAPVYVMFTKVDLIAGFGDFFRDSEVAERERIWGATLRFNRRRGHDDVLGFFDESFEELCGGLKEVSLATMGHHRNLAMRPGVLTFPLEFASIKPALHAFLATLFEENTYQFRPIFRGYYFTSAMQEGIAECSSSKRTAERFGLAFQEAVQESSVSTGFFLKQLFLDVIFADRDLVKRYAKPAATRWKQAAFLCSTLLLGGGLGVWSWSYMGNKQLIANVQADLDKIARMQEKRIDLQSRLEALDILHDRIEQLAKYREHQPWQLAFGLYQGEAIERKLYEQYFAASRELMLKPVVAGIEALLAEMNANPGRLSPGAAKTTAGQSNIDASSSSIDDSYNALKTYLMLGDKSHADASHLNDQLTRYWRNWLESKRGLMPREQMIRSAERLMSFHVNHISDPAWPQINLKLGLLDQARDNLRRVVRGTPARERVYADIKARASTRFSAVTTARLLEEQDQVLLRGSYAVPGAYTREAWEQFVGPAIKEAANKELQSTDWVLKTVTKDDLSLEGSPEQIQKVLIDLYKNDYAKEWQKFLQGVSVSDKPGFDAGLQTMNRLGDPQASPLAKLLREVQRQTAWDSPSLARVEAAKVENSMVAWFKDTVLRRAPSEISSNIDLGGKLEGLGPLGREFAGLARIVTPKEKDASLLSSYLDTLSKLRTRLNQLKNQGDPGPGAKQFMQQTLDGNGSELADALKYVDEQMLTGMSETQKQALRPILVRPLMQVFASIVQPSEAELNKIWTAQVLTPFQRNLADKYPFSPKASIEASAAEIAQVFGPEGAVAKFVGGAMGPLIVRRGDSLAVRTWAELGIRMAPATAAELSTWMGGNASAAAAQTVFQIQALPSPGVNEYTVEIDGQALRYRNTTPVWTNMVHPSGQGIPGARISATGSDGRSVELFNEAGQFGLKRLIEAATSSRKPNGVFGLQWKSGALAVFVDLKIVSSPDSTGNGEAKPGGQAYMGLRLPASIVGVSAVAPEAAVAAAGAQP